MFILSRQFVHKNYDRCTTKSVAQPVHLLECLLGNPHLPSSLWRREIDQVISHQTLLWYNVQIYLRSHKLRYPIEVDVYSSQITVSKASSSKEAFDRRFSNFCVDHFGCYYLKSKKKIMLTTFFGGRILRGLITKSQVLSTFNSSGRQIFTTWNPERP